MFKAHKIRLHPTPEQANYFARAAGTARFVFNWALAEWKVQYEAGGKPNAMALKKQFNATRGEQFPWTYEVTKCAIEGAFMDVAAAFNHFFAGRKAGRQVGYPQFKSKKRSRQSFYWPTTNSAWAITGLTFPSSDGSTWRRTCVLLAKSCRHASAKRRTGGLFLPRWRCPMKDRSTPIRLSASTWGSIGWQRFPMVSAMRTKNRCTIC